MTLISPLPHPIVVSFLFLSDMRVWEGLHICTQWPVHSDWGGGGDRWLMLFSPHWRRPYQTCSYVIRIVFSLLMSSSSGGLCRPPAVRQKLARRNANFLIMQRGSNDIDFANTLSTVVNSYNIEEDIWLALPIIKKSPINFVVLSGIGNKIFTEELIVQNENNPRLPRSQNNIQLISRYYIPVSCSEF